MVRCLLAGCTLLLLPLLALGQGKISGLAFADYFYNVKRDGAFSSIKNSVQRGEADFQGFEFRRIYLTYDHELSDRFSSRFRLEADQTANTSDGKIGVFVKDAYLRWNNIFPGSNVIFGIQPTTSFQVSEGVWGFRSVEKTIMDLRGIVGSRDLGISLQGKIDARGLANYRAMISNGSGNRPETDKFKRYFVMLDFKPAQYFSVSIGGDIVDRQSIDNPYHSSISLSNRTFNSSAFIGYDVPHQWAAGVESFYQIAQHGWDNGVALIDRNALGISLFGRVSLGSSTEILGRYDYFDPNTTLKGDIRGYIVAGVSWKPDEGVSIIPNILVETYEQLSSGWTFDPSVTARLTVEYATK